MALGLAVGDEPSARSRSGRGQWRGWRWVTQGLTTTTEPAGSG